MMETMAKMELMDKLVTRDRKVVKVSMANREILVLRAPPVPLDPLDLKDPRERTAGKEIAEQKEKQAQEEPLESMAWLV